MKNFLRHTGHLYTVKNQNGFNNALYNYYEVDKKGNLSKKEVRKMVQNFPEYYPISIIIIDQSFECSRVYIETLDLGEEHSKTGKYV